MSECGENTEGHPVVNSRYMGLLAVPHAFSSLPPLDSLFSGGLLGEGPEQHMTLRFRGSQQTMMQKHTLTPTDGRGLRHARPCARHQKELLIFTQSKKIRAKLKENRTNNKLSLNH